MSKRKKPNGGWGRETFLLRLVEFDRDSFGTPKNRSNTWDIKKTRDPRQDRRKSKKELQDDDK